MAVQEMDFTVRSFINVDFPAPFGPMIPTRLVVYGLVHNVLWSSNHSYLDKDSAQLILYKLGVDLPGYVKVQFVIFRIALVLLLTPIKEPGGGKENLTEVAAKV